MKFYYKSIENENYVMIGKKNDIYNMKMELANNQEIGEEIKLMYYSLSDYEADNGYINGNFVIKKDSSIFKYMVNHPEIFIDDDKNVSFEKVTNAFLIAVYENNIKMSNKIYPLFRNRVSGMKDDLSTEYSELVIKYILKNNDFDKYLNGDNDNDRNEYIIYDNYTYSFEEVKLKVKTNNK